MLVNVTNMKNMFNDAREFNQDIGNWNTSNVTTMNGMFYNAIDFNQDISSWNTSNVTDMDKMFVFVQSLTPSFSQDLSGWCVSKIESIPDEYSTSSPLTDANKPVWGTCPDYTIKVTASSNEDYTLSGTDRNGAVSGNDPTITLKIGDEVNFTVNAPNHPLYIQTNANSNSGMYPSGVNNNGQTDEVVNWKPTAAGTYYYQCSLHGGMGGTITVQ